MNKLFCTFEPIEWHVFWSVFFLPNTTVEGQKNHLPIFDSIQFQREKEFEKSQTQVKSLGSAFSADVSQILLPQTQGHKIAFEGDTLFYFKQYFLPGKYHCTIFANNFNMVRITRLFSLDNVSPSFNKSKAPFTLLRFC